MGYTLGYYELSALILIPAIILTFFAQFRVKMRFKKYSKIQNKRHITGKEAAEKILAANGMQSLPMNRVKGNLTDFYDPSDKSLNLSDTSTNDCSIAAVSVAAHEVGHAIQDHKGYALLRARNALVPVTNMVSGAAWPLVIVGIILIGMEKAGAGSLIMNLGIAFFAIVVLFHLVTLPVEIDASRRALANLVDTGVLDSSEVKGAKKMLSAAALTYLAALAVALANLFRIILLSRR